MTKKRFEELVETLAKNLYEPPLDEDNYPRRVSVPWHNLETWQRRIKLDAARPALTAVYPLIRDDVIGKCAEELVKLDNKDATGDEYTQGCYDENFWARVTIRALKSKDTKL